MAEHFLNLPLIYRLGTRWISYIPTSLSYAISERIADVSYIFYKSAVKNVKKNLALAFPEASKRKLSKMTIQLFRNYSKYLVDYGRFTRFSQSDILKQIIHFDDKDNLNNILRLNRGMILLTAHLGNWELGGIFFKSYGIKTNVVTLPDENYKIEIIRSLYRERFGVKTITIGNSPFSSIELTRALYNGEVVAMLIDRYNDRPHSIIIKFFNKPTPFPRGPFILSRLTGALIIVAFVVREEDGYRGIVKGPFQVTSEKEEYETLKRVIDFLEKYIIIYPDQWYNFVPI
ncbi:MAG: lysophospholipid acyltransferase family protein [Nitrospirota bacterium]